MQNNKNFFANLWLELAIEACIKIRYMFCGCFFPHKGRAGTWTWYFFFTHRERVETWSAFFDVWSPIRNVLERGVGFWSFCMQKYITAWDLQVFLFLSCFFFPHKARVRTWSCIETRAHKYCYWLALFVPTLLERAGTYPGTYWHVESNPQVPTHTRIITL